MQYIMIVHYECMQVPLTLDIHLFFECYLFLTMLKKETVPLLHITSYYSKTALQVTWFVI